MTNTGPQSLCLVKVRTSLGKEVLSRFVIQFADSAQVDG